MGICWSDAAKSSDGATGGESSTGGKGRTIFGSRSPLAGFVALAGGLALAGALALAGPCAATLAERTTGTSSLSPAEAARGFALPVAGEAFAVVEDFAFCGGTCASLPAVASAASVAWGSSFGQPMGAARSAPLPTLFADDFAGEAVGSMQTPLTGSHTGFVTGGMDDAMAGTGGAGLDITSVAVWALRGGTAMGTAFTGVGGCADAAAFAGCGDVVDAAIIFHTAGYWTTLNPTQNVSVAKTPSAAAILGMA